MNTAVLLSAAVAILALTSGCVTSTGRAISFHIAPVGEKMSKSNSQIIEIVRKIVKETAERHKFVIEQPTPFPSPYLDSANNRHACLSFHTRHDIESRMPDDHIQLWLINQDKIEILVYKMYLAEPSKYIAPALTDIMHELGKALELYPVSFEHDCRTVTINMVNREM